MFAEIGLDEAERLGDMFLNGVDRYAELFRNLFMCQVIHPAHIEYLLPLRR